MNVKNFVKTITSFSSLYFSVMQAYTQQYTKCYIYLISCGDPPHVYELGGRGIWGSNT